jgi:phosphate:Na+ symporter
MKENMEVVFGLLGGLAIFIFGMNMMSEGLQKAAGEKMKYILGILTKNPVIGVLAGALVTAVLQSSSATTVMVIGFVSAGLMGLPQAISVILGANIGTTMTAQLIAFKISDYIWPLVFIGFVIFFFSKKEKTKNIGQTIFAFGLLFVGIETMSDVMKPLAESPVFTDLLGRVTNVPILGVLLGTCMTLVVQSSSATIAVLQNFASQAGPDGVTSIIGLTGAIPILLGDNIGTTITALLASVGQSKNAKRTAVAHSVFNITGSFIFIWIIPWFAKFIQWISPKGPEVTVIARQIANAHTTFNVVNTLLWLPFIWVLVKIVTWIIPGTDEKQTDKSKPRYLDEKIFNQPVFALHLACQEILRCANAVKEMADQVKHALLSHDAAAVEKAYTCADQIQNLNDEIVKYLSTLLSEGYATENQSAEATRLLYVTNYIGRIGARLLELTDAARVKNDQHYHLSDCAMQEIQEILNQISDMMEQSSQALQAGDPYTAGMVIAKSDNLYEKEHSFSKNHMQRLHKGECNPEYTSFYTVVMHNIERIGNECTNIAQAVMDGAKISAAEPQLEA